MSKIEVGKTYQTRDGKNVRILATDLKYMQPVVGAILFDGGDESVTTFAADGSYYSSDAEHKYDLIIPTEINSRWVNWYGPSGVGIDYAARVEADFHASNFRTHVLEIIIKDGKPADVKIHEVGK